jgi:hypothetical protein
LQYILILMSYFISRSFAKTPSLFQYIILHFYIILQYVKFNIYNCKPLISIFYFLLFTLSRIVSPFIPKLHSLFLPTPSTSLFINLGMHLCRTCGGIHEQGTPTEAVFMNRHLIWLLILSLNYVVSFFLLHPPHSSSILVCIYVAHVAVFMNRELFWEGIHNEQAPLLALYSILNCSLYPPALSCPPFISLRMHLPHTWGSIHEQTTHLRWFYLTLILHFI